VLAAGPGYLFIDETGSIRELAQPEGDRTDVRMNDGACDAQGRFWAGQGIRDRRPRRPRPPLPAVPRQDAMLA